MDDKLIYIMISKIVDNAYLEPTKQNSNKVPKVLFNLMNNDSVQKRICIDMNQIYF